MPLHLQIAREFVAGTRPENNRYTNRGWMTRMPGEAGSADFVVATDCSRFVGDMFRRAGSGVVDRVQALRPGRPPRAEFWHASIVAEDGFARVRRVADLRPGDVASWVHAGAEAGRMAGHVLFIDSVPTRLASPYPPLVPGLLQYEVAVIDVSQYAKSRDDTRFVADAAQRQANLRAPARGTKARPDLVGVGRGHLRLYTDAAGEIRGLAFGFDTARFHGLDDWDIAAGRPRLAD